MGHRSGSGKTADAEKTLVLNAAIAIQPQVFLLPRYSQSQGMLGRVAKVSRCTLCGLSRPILDPSLTLLVYLRLHLARGPGISLFPTWQTFSLGRGKINLT